MIAPPASGRVSATGAWVQALELTARIPSHPGRIFSTVIGERAQRWPDRPALVSDAETLTYQELFERSNRYARWALDQGLRKGEVVCLLMPNRPEYLAIWLGITAVGGVVALLNTQLRGPSLAHCIEVVAPRHIIVDAELVAPLATARPALAAAGRLWVHGDSLSGVASIDDDLRRHSPEPLTADERRSPTIRDLALLIYTSGTTGLPKAARVSHFRLMQWTHWFAGMMAAGPSDRMYDCLPMYHSVGGVVAPGAALVGGGSVVIRDRFSARHFWADIARWDCTLFQYIGELCRYLLHADFHPAELDHRIRLCAGNGLRLDVWDRFKARFRIPRILEFYAATEANFSLFNTEGAPGSIGRIPPFLAHRFPITLIESDLRTEEPVRDPSGFCVRSAPNEVGEAIGMVATGPSGPGAPFEGYTSEAASERKILRDVFEPGDAWFRTGDLMRRDPKGHFYFVDRLGDTFRWKGENVSTSEVADALRVFPGVEDAIVYGVTIPGAEGRAGMAALVAPEGLDLVALRDHLIDRLPGYARPLFIRRRSELDLTGTFKHTKSELVRESFDPSATGDVIYFDDPDRKALVLLDQGLYDRIQSGHVRL